MAYTHQLSLHGATIVHNENHTAARATLEGGDLREFVSEPAKPGRPQPEPTATAQAIAWAKEIRKAAEEAAEAEKQNRRERLVAEAKAKRNPAQAAPATTKEQ